jgi:predicted acylesterase/phospholipase RssA
MAPAASSEPREVRLALVLNGGVSLAIWMGGVVGEIDALRLASDSSEDAEDEREFWGGLLRCLGLRVVVDVVAGTSAGGINGALLATAIARETKLPELRDTWIRLARYEKDLLIKGRGANTLSVLDGGFFLREMRKVITEEIRATGVASKTGSPDVTLFMTGTALVGDNTEYIDADGQKFTATDHRIRFTFRRNDERNDFHDGNGEQQASRRLARAARATASFPAAFEPIYVNNTGFAAVPPESPLDESPEGPDMSAITGLKASRWVIDGGVLDNEPFLPVLTEIAKRPVQGRLDRVIAYIVPALGEVVADPLSDVATPAPGVLRSVPAAFALPRGMSTLDDLDRLEQLAETANTGRETRKRLLASALTGELGAPDPTLFQLYREQRRDATAWEIRKLVRDNAGFAGVYLRPLPEAGEEGTCDLPWLPRDLGKAVDAQERWAWGVAVASRFLRSLLGLVRDQLEAPELDAERRGVLEEVVQALWGEIEKLEKIQSSLDEQLALALAVEEVYSLSDDEVNRLAIVRFEEGVAEGERAAGAQLWDIVQNAAATVVDRQGLPEEWRRSLDGGAGARKLLDCFFWAEVYERAAASPEYKPIPRFRFYRFGLNPRTWFLDSTLVFTRKLMGTQVHHFGAFFKDEWRAYDWTWGRLDGASHLINMLVTRTSLQRALADDGECLVELTAQADEMRGAIRRFRDAKDDEAAEPHVQEIRELLARARHASILNDELGHISEWWDGEKPATLVGIAGSLPTASEDDLREAWTAVCHRLGETSALGLTGYGEGRQILGLSVASFLRAVSQDELVPKKLGRILRWIALAIRGVTSRSWLGTVLRTAVVLLTVVCLILAVWMPFADGLWGTILRVLFGWLGGILTYVAVWLLPWRFKASGRWGLRNVSRLGSLVPFVRRKLGRAA